jgi:hypothetical protein
MAEEPRFDWRAIIRAVALIAGITAAVGFIIPAAVTPVFRLYHTGRVAGHDLYRWGFWVVAWALTFWQASSMLRRVHDAIIDDMALAAVVSGVVLLVVKAVITLVYEPTNSEGQLLPFPFTATDVGGALVMVIVALIGSRINKY